MYIQGSHSSKDVYENSNKFVFVFCRKNPPFTRVIVKSSGCSLLTFISYAVLQVIQTGWHTFCISDIHTKENKGDKSGNLPGHSNPSNQETFHPEFVVQVMHTVEESCLAEISDLVMRTLIVSKFRSALG